LIGIGVVFVVYLTLVQPPFHSAATQWSVRGMTLALIFYSVVIEPRRLQVTRHEVVIEGLSPALNGLRIAHATDFHVGAPGLTRWDFQRVVQRVEEFQPDLIALTGDLVARNGWNGLTLRDCLPVQAPQGCFAVLGNSDRRHADKVSADLQSLGVRVLCNQHALVAMGNAQFAVVGVDDPSEQRDDVEAARRGLPRSVGFTLLLAHAPEIVERLGQGDCDLILTGHTHGGQVNVPLFHLLSRKKVSHYRAGWFQVGKAKMYVNRGIGQVAPFRFLCPPEVALLTLRRKEI
jgi:hypothetical protein